MSAIRRWNYWWMSLALLAGCGGTKANDSCPIDASVPVENDVPPDFGVPVQVAAGDFSIPMTPPPSSLPDLWAPPSDLAGTPAPAWTPPPITFFSDFENAPYGGWPGIQYQFQLPLANSFQLVTFPVRQGKRSGEFIVAQGYSAYGFNEESQVLSNIFDGDTDDTYYGFSVLVPPDWKPVSAWNCLLEWHADFGTQAQIQIVADTAFRIEISAGDLTGLSCTHTDGGASTCPSTSYSTDQPISPSVNAGQWNDFILHIVWSNQNYGAVQVWHRVAGTGDFVSRLSLTNIPTLQKYQYNYSAARLMLGYYRASYCDYPTGLNCTSPKGVQPTSTIYYDNVIRGASYAAVRAMFDDQSGTHY